MEETKSCMRERRKLFFTARPKLAIKLQSMGYKAEDCNNPFDDNWDSWLFDLDEKGQAFVESYLGKLGRSATYPKGKLLRNMRDNYEVVKYNIGDNFDVAKYKIDQDMIVEQTEFNYSEIVIAENEILMNYPGDPNVVEALEVLVNYVLWRGADVSHRDAMIQLERFYKERDKRKSEEMTIEEAIAFYKDLQLDDDDESNTEEKEEEIEE